MTKLNNFSKEHIKYVKSIRKEKILINSLRITLLVFLVAVWEIFAWLNIIDSFITSSPSRIVKTIIDLFINNSLAYHILVTLYETLLGFILAVSIGYVVALLLYSSNRLKKVLEPYIVVLNSLPKIALGPLIIIWFGSGSKAIIFMAVLIGVVIATITMLNGFLSIDNKMIILLRSMGANKLQILLKLVIPGTIPTFISMLKMSIGMAWIGSIMGEYLVSRAGLGYLVVYGGQVFKLDLVMASTIILCLLATLMYILVSFIEKKVLKGKNN